MKIFGHGPVFWSEIARLETPGERAIGMMPSGHQVGICNNSPIKEEGVVPKLFRRYENLYGDLSDYTCYNALTRDEEYGPKFIEEFHEELKDYPIQFDATFSIKDFGERFFDFVSQQASGSYYGKEQGASRLKENIDGINMSDIQQIVDFTALINHDLFHDKRDGQCSCRIVEDQLKKGHTKQELYDFIYGMDYIIPFFQLKMNDKPLSSLSPGERGALLLLLYLFIDMDDKPLIIDQPEENLDNESVFKYLVHFIKVAKQKRQIIMVTHNPNLAVVCDADQIIQMKIDKLKGNAVTFESGAIENPKINKIIVDILEGTYPAFHNRDCKYFDKSLNFRQ